ncbi:hybrid signal transduction histidine kinase H-like [Cotesia glomerata]|uniref:Uncharacterized protein n=1 Tax=Cotesia glomerata TaxID=32391 RepID=A0AAV7HWV4_COTGL|nr:hybrid signal transduction histidine kinase H-like [Cotesia glomerata]KAH0535614.1 hypothetical protein KQX54_017683 [Cotesia glomerata]
MALGVFGSALKTLKSPKITFIVGLAVAIGVVYTCVSPWLHEDNSKNPRKVSKRSSLSSPVKVRVKKRKIIKLVPELTELSQKNEDMSTEFSSFRFRSDVSQLQNNIIYATTLKSKGTQTDFPNLVNAIDNNNNNNNNNYNYNNINDLHSSIEYKEIIKNDPPKIGVTIKKKIVKPPRKHPPSQTKAQLSFLMNGDDKINNNYDLKGKFYNSLYPEVEIIHCEDSKSFKSVLDRKDGDRKEENLSKTPEKKLSYLELTNSVEIESKKPKLATSFIKKCRRMLNFNDFDLNIESERKSPLKCWSSITSALGSQPAGHSTLIDINLSGVAAGGQDEDYNSPKRLKSSEKKINFDSVVKSKNLVVEMNSKERPESRIIDDDDDDFCQYCKDADFYSDLSVDKNKNYSSKESSRITGFGKDLHQFLRDVKSIFKIQDNYHNSEDNDNTGWVKMSALRRNTSVTLFNKINHNKGCYSFI